MREEIFVRLKEVSADKIEKFIKQEISPFLSIPLENKLRDASLREYVQKIIDKANGWCILDNNEIIGLIAGYINNRIENNKVYITMYGIARGSRKKGFGKCLMKKFCKEVPCDCEIYTNVDEDNINARMVYKKLGFREIEKKEGRLVIKKSIGLDDKLYLKKTRDIYSEIKRYSKEIYVWGCGSVANGVKNALVLKGIKVSGFFVNTAQYHIDSRLQGEKIYLLDELLLMKDKFSVIVGHSKYQLASDLNKYCQIENLWLLPAITRKNLLISQEFIKCNMKFLAYTYSCLSDSLSKENMVDYLNSHLLQDEKIIVDKFEKEVNYFDNDVVKLGENECYLDIGAYNGESIDMFIKCTGGKYKKIMGIEVIKEEFNKLSKKYANAENIILINKGISNHRGEDYFVFDGQSTCLATEKEGIKIEVNTIDMLCEEMNYTPTIIKICIGESILPILQGATNVLRKCAPKMVFAAGIDRYALVKYVHEIESIVGQGKYKYYLRFTDAMTECLILIAVPC